MSSAWVPLSRIWPSSRHQDFIGSADCSEAMRNDKSRAADHQVGKRFLDVHFGFGVEFGSRLIENQNRRILQDSAGDGDALALAAAQTRTAFADHRVVALRKLQMKSAASAALAAASSLFPSRRYSCRNKYCSSTVS